MRILPHLNIAEPWIWLRGAFPARTQALPIRTPPELPEKELDYSGISYEPFAWWDGHAYCWRTWQSCSIEGWERLSVRWPRSGMTRNGIAYQRAPLVPRRSATEFGLLPTLAKSEKSDWSQARILADLDKGGRVARRICRLSQTIRSSQEKVGLNPSFAEWMTNLPIGHTELEPAVMRSTPESPK